MPEPTTEPLADDIPAARSASPSALIDFAVDTIAMVCLRVKAPIEDAALRLAREVQGVSIESAVAYHLPDGVTLSELSTLYVAAVPYADAPDFSDVPITFSRASHRPPLTELADQCAKSATALRALANREEPTEGGDPEHDAAMVLAGDVERLVAAVRKLLADPDLSYGVL